MMKRRKINLCGNGLDQRTPLTHQIISPMSVKLIPQRSNEHQITKVLPMVDKIKMINIVREIT